MNGLFIFSAVFIGVALAIFVYILSNPHIEKRVGEPKEEDEVSRLRTSLGLVSKKLSDLELAFNSAFDEPIWIGDDYKIKGRVIGCIETITDDCYQKYGYGSIYYYNANITVDDEKICKNFRHDLAGAKKYIEKKCKGIKA